MITPTEFRNWLKAPRARNGRVTLSGKPLMAKVLADMLGVTPEAFSRWKHSGVPARRERIVRLAMNAIDFGLGYWR